MINNLLKGAKITRVANAGAGAASATPTKGTIIDMAGFQSVMFIATMADVVAAADVKLRAAQSPTNDTNAMTLLQGFAGGVAGAADMDNKMLVLDVVRPNERFIEAQIFHVDQNAPFSSIVAIQYDPKDAPVTQGATVYDAETLANPNEV